ncbi:hypothetical protein H8S95_00330 [Pontibacter sp. KCTC 32443]|uniref:hypothetical protein n=1 Tax=Pontibacter TaxID=323449 RepID=UPI00164D79DB|nr:MULTISPECIES: hypothetical protein [Pontibacter]MBC5772497.1 hypothetical protein [Pontibacter sp. KCTC 32443]
MHKKTTKRLPTLTGNAFAFFILCSTFLAGCQPSEQQETTTTAVEQTTAAADRVQRRPAPKFYIIPPGSERTRVFVCDNGNDDVFHKDGGCKVFTDCKGTKRNVSLQRAIEEFGRYNCEVCSKELGDIFDDKKIR